MPTQTQPPLFETAAHSLQAEVAEDEDATLAEAAARWRADPLSSFQAWAQSQRAFQREFAAHSVEQYTTMFGAFVQWLGEKGIAVEDAKPEHLDLFIMNKQGRNGRPAADTTRRRYMRLLHRTYEHLRLLELRKDNPAEPLIDLARHQDFVKPAPTILSAELAERYKTWVLDQPEPHWVDVRNKALRLIFMASGITVAEAQRLRLDDMLLDAGRLQLHVLGHGFVAAREAPVASYAVPAIVAWRQLLARIAPDVAILFPARNFTFGNDRPEAGPVAAAECFLIVQEAMEAIGFTRGRQGPQTLRNTFIARQIWEGRPAHRIMAWCGLRTNETVQRISRLVPLRADGVAPA